MEARPTIGVLSPFVSGFYFGGVISGIAGVAAEAGVRLLAIQTSDPGVDYSERPLSSQHPHAAAWEHLEGCIVVVDAATPGYLDAIRRTGKPIVTVSKQLDGFRCPTVQPDNRAGVRMAMRHLLDHGHRRIAFAGTMAQDDIRERYEAYVEMLGEAGIDEDPSLVYTTADNAESFGYETGNRMLANGMASTALLAASDLVAIGVIQAFTAAGLELPRDQAIVGFDDIEAASFVKPTLSSVRQDFGALGRLAASLLLDKLRGVEVADERHDAPVRFVARESCGCIDTAVGSPSRPVRVRGLTARRRWLAGQLDATLLADGDDDGRAATVDHAARLIAQSMEAAAKREPGRPPRPGQPDQHGPSEAAMAEALEALYRRSPRNQTVRGVMEAARQYGRELLACKVIDQGSAARSVANCVIDITVAMSAIHSRNQFGDNTYFRAALASQYSLSMDLLRSHEEDPRSLQWLERTGVRGGCLGLWQVPDPDKTAVGDPALDIVGVFDRDHPAGATADPDVRTIVEASRFPPTGFLELVDEHAGDVVFVLPVKVRSSDWGLLGVVGPIDNKVASGRETVNQWAALLAVALDHRASLASLTEQRRSLERSYERERGLVEVVRLSEERYALAAQAGSGGLWDWDLITDGVFYSARWRALVGCAEQAVGTTANEWFGRVHPEDSQGLLAAVEDHLVGRSKELEWEHRLRCEDGRYVWVLCRALVIRDSDGRPIRMVGSLTDVHDRKMLEEQLRHAALYDALTGLPNRTLFLDRLRLTMARAARRPNYNFAVLFLDLDGFKLVNDSLGHLLGDKLLSSVAERIASDLRPSDTASRFGGDEFAILLDDVVSPHNPGTVADRLQTRLAQPFDIDGHEIVVSASIGIASSSTGYDSAEDVLRDADTAMYRAKAREKGTHATFDAGMHTRAVTRLRVEGELRHAIGTGQLALHYQPIVELRSGHTVGFEALVRWQHPERGLLAPAEFLSIAEETGLIVPIGRWVLEEACRQRAAWRDTGAPDSLRISVNVSNRQFWHGSLLDDVESCLRNLDLAPRHLALEITETVVMHNAELAERMLTELHEHGFALHIDDFGTGYSSLQALHRFPIEALKVDRSFVWRLGSDPRSTELVRTIVMMAHNLGVDVVAEGIETSEQCDRLKRLQCIYGQGYLFSKPVPGAEAAAFISRVPEQHAFVSTA